MPNELQIKGGAKKQQEEIFVSKPGKSSKVAYHMQSCHTLALDAIGWRPTTGKPSTPAQSLKDFSTRPLFYLWGYATSRRTALRCSTFSPNSYSNLVHMHATMSL